MKPNMRGVGIALITPFSEDGSVDFGALEALVERVTAGGADYLVVLGTTAETPTLTADEKEAVVSCVVRKNNGRLPVVLGMGGNNTAEVVASIRKTDFTGIDAILTVFISITRRLPLRLRAEWCCTTCRDVPAST